MRTNILRSMLIAVAVILLPLHVVRAIDCDTNGIDDAIQLADAATGCRFPLALLDNATGEPDATYVGPSDDVYAGIGGQILTFTWTCGTVVDGPGADFTVYEVDFGGAEFSGLDVLASLDGVNFVSIASTLSTPVKIPGQGVHANSAFARSYDLAGSGLSGARYLRLDGAGTGAGGGNNGFDLDAVGAIHVVDDDCDASGVVDACEGLTDCNGNFVPESCEVASGYVADCDTSGTPDTCDTLGGVDDCDGDTVPDNCEADCNNNATPDDCDIAGATSNDCNGNDVPDECDLLLNSVTIETEPWTRTSQLVFSESFETPDTANFTTYNAGETIVTADASWDVVVSGVDLYEAAARAEAAAADGAQAIDLTGSPGAGVIETTLPTVSGQAYELRFQYARNDLLGASTGDARVEMLGLGSLLDATIQHDPALHAFSDYLEYRGLFIADSASTTLRFTSLNPGNTGITLDAIEVVELLSPGAGLPLAGGVTTVYPIAPPFPAAGDVATLVAASADFNATGEYFDLRLGSSVLNRFFDDASPQCSDTDRFDSIDGATFNAAVAAGEMSIELLPPSAVNGFECANGAYAAVRLTYEPVVDCNTNGALDACEIANATSTDLNLNGIADECEVDCNGNMAPDDYDVAQGTSLDCNANLIPDECDVVTVSLDCNGNIVPDECEIDCNSNSIPDDCDIVSMTSLDCDGNVIPDECDLAVGMGGCPFPRLLLDNGTTTVDSDFLGAPDDTYFGIGGQIVTFEFDCGFVTDGPGGDFNIYELSTSGVEFDEIEDVLVSADGVTFVSVHATEGPMVNIPGDEVHANNNFGRSYDIFFTGLNAVRFIRIDGVGTGASGTSNGFDLDAIGAIHRADIDCDGGGVPDQCESFTDCNLNGLKDSCEFSLGLTDDCNTNGTLDSCDVTGGAADVDFDWIPDSCEPDCNTNNVPDHWDIEQLTSIDCNDNVVPDECDLASASSLDCNNDSVPDECPVCPTVEVVFIVDTSSSMDDEGAALCADLTNVIAELQADLVNVDVETLGILATAYGCLTDTVGNLYGTAVPGTPPAGQEILGDSCGANLNEDWGLATSIVAGLKPWQADSVRLIVPISDEGPRCGNPVTDPGSDRDAINHAIGQARSNDVIVSPVGGTGSSASLLAIMDVIAAATDGQTFSTVDPELDLAGGLSDILAAACFSRTDCNGNTIPDDCDLVDMTSQDCNMTGRPDECEDDCNGNGLADSCDITNMTSFDDNLNTVPDECEGLLLTGDGTDWNWTGVPGAIGFDLIQGTLSSLQSSAGDFAVATDQCVVNDTAGMTWPDGPVPAAGEAYWYLVRGVIGVVDLSYDTFGAGLIQTRDPGIIASGVSCP